MTDFEPARYLTRLQGSDYLEVKWRLVWFRKAAPLGAIETECLYHDHERALFKATARLNTIQMDDGTLVKDVPCVATGHGSETVKDFKDYIEKAETKAIGRALAALGFGTQFAPDIDDGSSIGRVVDAPVQRATQTTPQQRNAAPQQGDRAAKVSSIQNGASGPSEAQIRFLHALAKENGLDHDGLNAQINARFGKSSVKDLTGGNGGEASRLIELLKAKDLIDGVPVAGERVDPVEAAQQGSGFMGSGIKEPEFLRGAPDPWA